VHVPVERIVTVVEATVQMPAVVDVKATARADVEVAETPNVPAENGKVVTAGVKEIVCGALVIVKLTDTGVAAA